LIVIFLILVAVALVVVLQPFFVHRRDPELEAMLGSRAAELPSELEREKVFTMLGELEYDFRMDKISEEDYRELRSSLAQRAAELVTAEGGTGDRTAAKLEQELERELEQELERIISQLARTTGAKAGETSPGDAPGFCPDCGAQLLKAGQRFCQACGAALTPEGADRDA